MLKTHEKTSMSSKEPRYLNKDPIIAFITAGLNRTPVENAFGYDAIEILTEIEYADELDLVSLREEVRKQTAQEIFDKYFGSIEDPAEYKREYGLC